MIVCRRGRILSLVLFLLIASPTSNAQEDAAWKCTLVVHDVAGHFRLLKFGLDSRATYELEREFGEMLIPPIPPEPIFDARFADLPNRRRLGGTGTETDIRKLYASTQTDTFVVRIQAAEDALPLRLSWIVSGTASCKQLLVRFSSEGEEKLYDATDFSPFYIRDSSVSALTIILHGPNIESQ